MKKIEGSNYIIGFLREYRPIWQEYEERGLRDKEWRNIGHHQVLCGVMVQELGEMIGLPVEEIQQYVGYALKHDINKRDNVQKRKRGEVMDEEINKSGIGRATSTNFVDFEDWSVGERLLRFADSSVGGSVSGETIQPWRDRVAELKVRKADEHHKGVEIYGMGMWDKLAEVTLSIEKKLYDMAIARDSSLETQYPNHSCLTQMVIDRINSKIKD